MSDERFVVSTNDVGEIIVTDVETGTVYHYGNMGNFLGLIRLMNEQQELIEELQVSDEMGWKRAEHFEKKCPKELHNKKMYIKRLEYKVQKFKEMNSEQQATIEHLKKRVYDFEKRKIIEESEIDEDVIPRVKLLRSELFGEKYE